jgi:5'-nucleotidase
MTHVLLTNDDGIDAPGLALLERCARRLFDEVTVVAPCQEQSGVGQGITLETPLRRIPCGESRYAVTGTPTDCVIVAMGTLFPDRPPDLVLSGVNRGPNLGRDVFYSGTVAGAREALFHGIPSVALSLVGRNGYPFERYEGAVDHVLESIAQSRWKPDHLLNVNIPVCEDEAAAPGLRGIPGLKGVRVTRLGERFYNNEVIVRQDPRDRDYMWIGGSWPTMVDRPGTDCNAMRDGYISVTPVGLELTQDDALSAWAHLEE